MSYKQWVKEAFGRRFRFSVNVTPLAKDLHKIIKREVWKLKATMILCRTLGHKWEPTMGEGWVGGIHGTFYGKHPYGSRWQCTRCLQRSGAMAPAKRRIF